MSSSVSDPRAFLIKPLVQAILSTHPNNYDDAPSLLSELLEIPHLHVLNTHSDHDLLEKIQSSQLNRNPIIFDDLVALPSEHGMSPKKVHEVSRMVTYILRLIQHHNLDPKHIRIVDVGAGQGYLTRALKYHLQSTCILALDADEEQTKGAQRWEARLLPAVDIPINHKTILVSPETLESAVTEWVGESPGGLNPVPVIFVALHACGSLIIDVLRTFLTTISKNKTWQPWAAVAVGCCYNLMNPGDFPLSEPYLSQTPPLDLPVAAYHLAAQIPSQWLECTDPPTLTASAALALRKVAWRALLGKSLPGAKLSSEPAPTVEAKSTSATVPARWNRRPEMRNNSLESSPAEPHTSTGETPAMRRLGKLPNSAYQNWNTFLHAAQERMGVAFPPEAFDGTEPGGGRDIALETKIVTLHTWRCLVGPVVETAILEDRILWIHEQLERAFRSIQTSDSFQPLAYRAELVNLFDQATGSGRNVAIVLQPTSPFADGK